MSLNMQQKNKSENSYEFVTLNPLRFLKGSGINEKLNNWVEEQIEGIGMDGRLYSRLISSIMKMSPSNLIQELKHMDIEFGEGKNEYFLRKLMLLTLWTGDYSSDECASFNKIIDDFLSKHKVDQDGLKNIRRKSCLEPIRSGERYDEAFPALSFNADELTYKNASMSLLDWAGAVNSFNSLHKHSSFSLQSIKPLKKFCNKGRSIIRMIQQAELKPSNLHHRGFKGGKFKFGRHKKSSNWGKKVKCDQNGDSTDEGRITDNEENYPYIEIVRRFQSWGSYEKVYDKNPFPSILFPMNDFADGLNKIMKDENLLSVDEEGIKGIWAKIMNETSGQSLCNNADVSIGEDNIMTPSPKLSWTNFIEPSFVYQSNCFDDKNTHLLKDLILQNFYSYEENLVSLISQKNHHSSLWNDCFTYENLRKIEDNGKHEVQGSAIKKDLNNNVDYDVFKSEYKDGDDVDLEATREVEHAEEEKMLSSLFDNSLNPRFSTPKFPKLDVLEEKYQAITMLGVENITFNQLGKEDTSLNTDKVRVKLEEIFNALEKASNTEMNSNAYPDKLSGFFNFNSFERKEKSFSLSDIIFADKKGKFPSPSSFDVTKDIQNNGQKVEYSYELDPHNLKLGMEEIKDQYGYESTANFHNYPKTHIHNYYTCELERNEKKKEANMLPLPLVLVSNCRSSESYSSLIECWDRFLAIPTSTRQLVTFSQSKFSSYAKDTSVSHQISSEKPHPSISSDVANNHCDKTSAGENQCESPGIDANSYQNRFLILENLDLGVEVCSQKTDHSTIQNEDGSNFTKYPQMIEVQSADIDDKDESLFTEVNFSESGLCTSNKEDISLYFTCQDLPFHMFSRIECTNPNTFYDVESSVSDDVKLKESLDESVNSFSIETEDSILEVVSEHLNKLREEFEKKILEERLDEWSGSKVEKNTKSQKDYFDKEWDMSEVLLKQLDSKRDFVYDTPQMAFS